jgi:MFS family permease
VSSPQSPAGPVPAPELPWYQTITRAQWQVLIAAKVGWMLDAFDFMIYTMALNHIKTYFGFGKDLAGFLTTATLVVSALGGLLFGVIADRIGRTRALMLTIIIFSVCSLGAATSQNFWQLLLWRALLGIGMGGEWASGAVLVSETWPAKHRGKAVSIMQSGWALGYMLAAVAGALVLGDPSPQNENWRWLFAIGVVPALAVLWIRHAVPEPEVWKQKQAVTTKVNPFAVLFGPQLIGRTLLAIALTSAVQFAYWGLFSWLPPFLATPVSEGGAGMSVVGSLGWIIATQVGAYLGYLSFGFIAERLGRRLTFILFLVTAAVIVPIYGHMAREPNVLLILSPFLGFVGHGYFSLFGALLAELFPTAVRATGQGLTYNCGRITGALGPFTIGYLATLPDVGLGSALALTSAFFIAGAVLIFFLPDTSGRELTE